MFVLFVMYDEKSNSKIGYKILLITLLAVLQPTSALVDCRTACRKCHAKTEAESVVEVYCAMCEECKQRRREKLEAQTTTTETIRLPATDSKPPLIYKMWEEEQATISFSMPWTTRSLPTMNPNYDYLRNSFTAEQIRTSIVYPPTGCPTPLPCPGLVDVIVSPTTTSPLHCPMTEPCRTKKGGEYQPCYPCYPMCPCPVARYSDSQTQSSTSEIKFHQVFIGVPKNLLRKS